MTVKGATSQNCPKQWFRKHLGHLFKKVKNPDNSLDDFDKVSGEIMC